MTVKVASFLAKLIEAIENARAKEFLRWIGAPHFQALDSCLEEAQELLHFELTRAPTPVTPKKQPKVSKTISRRVTRQSTAEIRKQRIYLPDEVLNVIFSYFKDTLDNPTHLSSNAYNFSLVCKSWHRVANQRLWQNVHLSSKKSAILIARSLYEQHDQSPTRSQENSSLSLGDGMRGLHFHTDVEICPRNSLVYVLNCVNLYTRNIVSLNLKGLSTYLRPLKVTEFYEIIKLRPHLKHVWLSQVDIDSVEPIDPLPQLETCDCSFQRDSVPLLENEVGHLELISAKTISIANVTVFKKDAAKSVYCEYWTPFLWDSHEYKQLTHLYLNLGDFDDCDEDDDELCEGFSHVVKLPNLSFLILDHLTFLTSSSFDLIAEHCSLTTFVINWQPDEDSVESWCALIKTLGPKLLSVGVGLDEDGYEDHPCILQTIYQNCPNLMTLELYGNDISSDVWSLDHASELENLCLLPLEWIYAPWFKKWSQGWDDPCPNFAKLCRLGLDVGLDDFPLKRGVSRLLDYNERMRPAIVGDGFCI